MIVDHDHDFDFDLGFGFYGWMEGMGRMDLPCRRSPRLGFEERHFVDEHALAGLTILRL